MAPPYPWTRAGIRPQVIAFLCVPQPYSFIYRYYNHPGNGAVAIRDDGRGFALQVDGTDGMTSSPRPPFLSYDVLQNLSPFHEII